MAPAHDQVISEDQLMPNPPYNGPLHISALKGPNAVSYTHLTLPTTD